jgi:hypothetical protein
MKRSRRIQVEPMPEEARFYQLMMTVLVAIALSVFGGLYLSNQYEFKNPWIVGNILMGGYALITGLLIGTAGKVSRLPPYLLSVILLFGSIIWLRYFQSSPGYCKCPTLDSVRTVRVGVILCLTVAFVSVALTLWKRFRHD